MTKIPRYGLSHFERRRSNRTKIFEPAAIDTTDGAHRVHVLDLSVGGALLVADVVPAIGSTIVIRLHERRIWSKVVWVEDGHFGASFLMPVPSEYVDQITAPKKRNMSAA